jgi:hypothetical protein
MRSRTIHARCRADFSVVRASTYDLDAGFYPPEERDCEGKRMFYISMGIPTFWLIE